MLRIIMLCFVAWVISPSCVQVSNAQKPLRSAIPVLTVLNDTGSALQISSLAIDVVVIGNIATTTFDIAFYNDRDRVLEGAFEFPLADGQNISRYALDMNGKLREGVVVEKAKARAAFENTVRRKIDPGLAEKTKGNNFRTRIYPIPAKGYKRVVIGIEETLGYVNKDMFYSLLLYTAKPIDSFSIKTTVLTNTAKPALQDNKFNNFSFDRTNNTWVAQYAEPKFSGGSTIAFTIPFGGNDNDLLYTETVNDSTWFYLHARKQGEYRTKGKPASVVLLWDISSSGSKRNVDRETALIEQYMASLKNVTITVVPFNIDVQAAEIFTISNGNATRLIERLKHFSFDGGTQLGAIDLTTYKADEILLFSDGLSTFGKSELLLAAVPVIAINSSPNADFSYLKFIAQKTNGKFIDLNKTAIAIAIEDIVKEPLKIISVTYSNNEVQDVVAETGVAIHNGFSVSGILKKPSATITINFGFGGRITGSADYLISIREQPQQGNIKRIWAIMKIAELDLQYEKNKQAITQLGKQFSVVTQNTSLLVLDRVEDYVQYEIEPPAELQKEYYVLLTEKHLEKRNENEESHSEAAGVMKELKDWWSGSLRSVQSAKVQQTRFTPPVIVADSEAEEAPSAENLSDVKIGYINQEGIKDEGFVAPAASRAAGDYKPEEQDKLMVQDIRLENAPALGFHTAEKRKVGDEGIEPAIELNEWKPDAPYLKILEALPANKRYERYLELKKDYLNQPSFFVDVARFFYAMSEKHSALLVLSNIAEMKLEDAELLRIVANQLLEAGELLLAIETFKQISDMREEEPQSYRDLALAMSESGQYNEAVQLLNKVITGTWDNRFNSVRKVALSEMNAIISAHPNVNTSGIEKEFISAMPLDVRIVISWSSDNSDVDLWVTEPCKEKCYYENPLTKKGGRLSGDITQGYGPEEYIIRKASKGDYVIEANLFGDSRQTLGGPITVKAELFTGFGRPTQKRKVINFRVTTNKEVVKIGSLGFGESR